MELTSLQQKIYDAVFVNLKASRPSVIQIGQRGGKDTIITKILESSSVTSPLVITPEISNFRKRNLDVSFLKLLSHNDLEQLIEAAYRTGSDFRPNNFDLVVLAEPWFWVLRSGKKSEHLYNRTVELFDGRVLAIGSYCETNIWSFDGLIPKYASYETNPLIEETVKELHKQDKAHAQRSFERNL